MADVGEIALHHGLDRKQRDANTVTPSSDNDEHPDTRPIARHFIPLVYTTIAEPSFIHRLS
jgi:hypothetical protein